MSSITMAPVVAVYPLNAWRKAGRHSRKASRTNQSHNAAEASTVHSLIVKAPRVRRQAEPAGTSPPDTFLRANCRLKRTAGSRGASCSACR